jgi:hypothetical protein
MNLSRLFGPVDHLFHFEKMTNLSQIHMTIDRELKGRWVKASRDLGMKLTDWIIQHVEENQKILNEKPREVGSK